MQRIPPLILTVIAMSVLATTAAAAELSSQQQKQILQEATAEYERGLQATDTDVAAARDAFAAAAEKYELLVDSGISNARLYENLGNATLQSGRLGAAIAAYEHAAALSPGSESVRRHLDHARALRDDKADQSGTSLTEQLARWNQSIPARSRLIIGLIAWTLMWACLVVWLILRQRTLSRCAIAAAVLVTAMAGSLAFDWSRAADRAYGIVTAPTLMRTYNGEAFDPVLAEPLSEGTEFSLVDQRGGWLQIKLADGPSGWVPAHSCDVIEPAPALWN